MGHKATQDTQDTQFSSRNGIRVPDGGWASSAFMARHGGATPCPQAPEISIVGEAGGLQVFDADGQRLAGRYGFVLPHAR